MEEKEKTVYKIIKLLVHNHERVLAIIITTLVTVGIILLLLLPEYNCETSKGGSFHKGGVELKKE